MTNWICCFFNYLAPGRRGIEIPVYILTTAIVLPPDDTRDDDSSDRLQGDAFFQSLRRNQHV